MQSASCPPRLTENNKAVTAVVFLGAGLVLGAMLFFLNPATTWIFPPCVFHKLTGLYCPGCGSTRALHCLLHGEFLRALHNNALIVLGMPVLGALLLIRVNRPRSATTTGWRLSWIIIALGVVVLFGIIRNINREPFLRLAPPMGVEVK